MKASILINNYNYSQYVCESIDSAFNQDYTNFEVILFDDASNDNSIEVIENFINKKNFNLKIIKNYKSKKNYPSWCQMNAIKTAFYQSTGDIICLLDSDDIFFPDKLLKVVNKFDEDDRIGFVQHRFNIIRDNDNVAKKKSFSFYKPKSIPDYYKKTNNLNGLYAQTSALSFRREVFKRLLEIQLDEYPLVWPDVRFSRIAPLFCKIYSFDQPLGGYRVHQNNDSIKLKNKNYYDNFLIEEYNYFNKYSHRFNFKKVSLDKSFHNPKLKPYKKLIKLIFGPEPIGVKFRVIYNITKNLLGI